MATAPTWEPLSARPLLSPASGQLLYFRPEVISGQNPSGKAEFSRVLDLVEKRLREAERVAGATTRLSNPVIHELQFQADTRYQALVDILLKKVEVFTSRVEVDR